MSILTQPFRLTLDRLGKRVVPTASCLLCAADSGREPLCAGCTEDLPPLPAARCPHCGDATTYGERCGGCLKRPPHFDACHALWRYDFPADRLVQALKYGHQLALAAWFGRRLAALPALAAADRILALPLHPERLAERGFNQAMEIARALGKRLGKPVDRSSLTRIRATPHQTELPLKARHANVRGAFSGAGEFEGQRILLVDDVLTTGATADECARVLKQLGAARVELAVVARAYKH